MDQDQTDDALARRGGHDSLDDGSPRLGALSLEVVDTVAAAEEGSQPASSRQALAEADLVGVGIDDYVWTAVA